MAGGFVAFINHMYVSLCEHAYVNAGTEEVRGIPSPKAGVTRVKEGIG